MNRRILIRGLAASIALAVPTTLALTVPTGSATERLIPVTPAPVAGIAGRYIVTVNDGADINAVIAAVTAEPIYIYTSALRGFAAPLSAAQLALVQANGDVTTIEQDQAVQASTTQTMTVGGSLWGLDRIDQRTLPLSGSYTYTSTGTGVRVYVIDSGIQTSHPAFGGRASAVYDALGGNGQDCNGHGTHVAGTVGAATHGVAKNVYLRAVRVLNCSGSGSVAGIIAAVDWVRANRINPAVANLSVGSGFSSSFNTAVTNLVNSGVFAAVAAGNSAQPACNESPGSAAASFTVAASDKFDQEPFFSNYGSCVDIYGPGVGVRSAWINSSYATLDGTSMASPHVAGVAALYKATFGDASSSTIATWLVNNATNGAIVNATPGTPNRLLYKSTL